MPPEHTPGEAEQGWQRWVVEASQTGVVPLHGVVEQSTQALLTQTVLPAQLTVGQVAPLEPLLPLLVPPEELEEELKLELELVVPLVVVLPLVVPPLVPPLVVVVPPVHEGSLRGCWVQSTELGDLLPQPAAKRTTAVQRSHFMGIPLPVRPYSGAHPQIWTERVRLSPSGR